MLRTCAAYVPHKARARRDCETGVTEMDLPSTVTETSPCITRFKVPPLPLTTISLSETETSVPAGIVINFLPVRDISYLFTKSQKEPLLRHSLCVLPCR